MPNAFNYGSVKSLLAGVYEGGMSSDDSRLLPTVNAAVDWLIRSAVRVNPRGLFVGGVDVLTIMASADPMDAEIALILLPITHDAVIQVDVGGDLDIKNGWYNILDLSGLVNPDFQQDVVFIDRGEVTPGGVRQYEIPTAQVGFPVKVTAIKRFTPLTGDSSVIPIRSLEAVKAAIKVVQYRGQGNEPERAIAYEKIALDEIKADFDRYLLDSTQSLARRQAYLNDERNYGREMLGYVRAKLALDAPGGQQVGKTVITRAINRAVERLLQHRNEIRTTGRLSVKSGVANVVFAPAVQATDVLQITDYEQIRCMVRSFDEKDPNAGAMEARAYKLLEDQELNKLETLRHTDYSTTLATDPAFSRQWYAHKWALDNPDGLKYSDVELKRLAQRAAEWIYQKKYEYQIDGRNRIQVGIPPLSSSGIVSDGVPFTDAIPYEEMKLAMDSFAYQGDPVNKTVNPQAESLQESVKKLLYARLSNELELLRHTTYRTNLNAATVNSRTWYALRWALNNPNGLKYSTAELYDLVNQAASRLYELKYEYQLVDRNRIKSGAPTISTVPGSDSVAFADALPYEEMRLAMDSLAYQGDPVNKTPNPSAAGLMDSARAVLERRLETELEALRHTTYANALQTIIAANGIQTLGYAFNKLQLETPGGIRISDVEMRRLVNGAVREAIQRRNELGATEEYTNLIGPDQLPYTQTLTDGGVLPYSDFEIIRLFVLSMLPGGSESNKIEAEKRIEANLRKSAIAYRNSEAHCIILSNPYPQFGGAWGQMMLEYADGLMMNSGKAKRLVIQAWTQAIAHYASLTRQEDYQATVPVLPVPVVDSSVIPFTFEVIKLFTESQIQQDQKAMAQASQYKEQAFALMERNLKATLESARRNQWEANLNLPRWSHGWMKAKVGLQLLDKGFQFPDTKIGRFVNDAEENLARNVNFVGDEAVLEITSDENRIFTLPADTERIIYASVCGVPLVTKSRSFEFLGYPAGLSHRPDEYPYWGVTTPWGWHGNAALQDRGMDDTGRRLYLFTGCWQNDTITLDGKDVGVTTIKVILKRRFVPKVNNTDLMLVQNLQAIRLTVEAELERLAKNIPGAAQLESAAKMAMDEQLANHHGAEVTVPNVKFAGQRSVSRRGLAGRFGRW